MTRRVSRSSSTTGSPRAWASWGSTASSSRRRPARPVGAIPSARREHRGVTKIKLNTKRCFPIVAQAAGCAVCMKVCPVQAYGLDAVLDEFGRTGRILGKDTDDLEGYDWFFDGRHYPPGRKPRVPAELVSPRDMPFAQGPPA